MFQVPSRTSANGKHGIRHTFTIAKTFKSSRSCRILLTINKMKPYHQPEGLESPAQRAHVMQSATTQQLPVHLHPSWLSDAS